MIPAKAEVDGERRGYLPVILEVNAVVVANISIRSDVRRLEAGETANIVYSVRSLGNR